jgi:hypothetical protein
MPLTCSLASCERAVGIGALLFQQPLQPVAVAVNVTGFPAIPKLEAVAVSVLLPNAGPTLQLPTVATPLGFVVV